MALRTTWDDYHATHQRLWGTPGVPAPGERREAKQKPHKYGAKRVTVDGHNFPSLLEARTYTALKLQWQAGQITEPLLQVRFSLGVHYGRERFYVADFVFVECGHLVVADAKGHKTKEYLQKRKMVQTLYGIKIREYTKK